MSGLDYLHGAAAQEHLSNMMHGDQLRALNRSHANQIHALNNEIYELKSDIVALKKTIREKDSEISSLRGTVDSLIQSSKMDRKQLYKNEDDVKTSQEMANALAHQLNIEIKKFIEHVGNFVDPNSTENRTVRETLAQYIAEDLTTKASFGVQSTFRNEIARMFVSKFEEQLKIWRDKNPDVIEIPTEQRRRIMGFAVIETQAYLKAQAHIAQNEIQEAKARKNGG